MINLYPLSVRAGQWRDPTLTVRGDGVAVLQRTRRAVILIHGFANSQARADESYVRLAAGLADNLWLPRPERLARFFGFHWPGDHRLPVISQLTYSSRVGAATASGHALGRQLANLDPDVEVMLVAHSLGCRVLLAAFEWIVEQADGAGPRITAAFLLAAAVPVGECVPPERFAARHPGVRYVVLHSHRDRALMLAFRPGQFFFDQMAQAVGRYGLPERDRWDQRIPTGLGHSAYWRSPLIAQTVSRALSPFCWHLLPELPQPLGVIEDADWPLPDREAPTRHLPSDPSWLD